jgi:hypothetical protein
MNDIEICVVTPDTHQYLQSDLNGTVRVHERNTASATWTIVEGAGGWKFMRDFQSKYLASEKDGRVHTSNKKKECRFRIVRGQTQLFQDMHGRGTRSEPPSRPSPLLDLTRYGIESNPGPWGCAVCTNENPSAATVCSFCQTPLAATASSAGVVSAPDPSAQQEEQTAAPSSSPTPDVAVGHLAWAKDFIGREFDMTADQCRRLLVSTGLFENELFRKPEYNGGFSAEEIDSIRAGNWPAAAIASNRSLYVTPEVVDHLLTTRPPGSVTDYMKSQMVDEFDHRRGITLTQGGRYSVNLPRQDGVKPIGGIVIARLFKRAFMTDAEVEALRQLRQNDPAAYATLTISHMDNHRSTLTKYGVSPYLLD